MRRAVLTLVLAIVLCASAVLAWLAMRAGDAVPVEPPAVPDALALAHEPEPAPGPHVVRERARPEPAATEPVVEEPAPDAAESPWDGPVATGHVVDADGSPVAGARVVSHADELRGTLASDAVGGEGSRTFVRTSGDDGAFTLPLDRDSVSLVLTATADEGLGQVALLRGARTATIRLEPWRTLTGRVTDIDEQPVAGAQVRVCLMLDALVEERSAVSGDDGAYRVERVPPIGFGKDQPLVGVGRHAWLIAQSEGFAPTYVEEVIDGRHRAETEIRIDVTLRRGLTLTGTVVDGDTRRPVADATVVCWSNEGMVVFASSAGETRRNPVGSRALGRITSDADGVFRFEHLPVKGARRFVGYHRGRRGPTLGYVVAWKDGYAFGGDEIPVSEDGATLESTIALWPSATVEGRVVDTEGSPVEGVAVFATMEERRPPLNGFPQLWEDQPVDWPHTDVEGRYRIDSFRASRNGSTTGSLYAMIRVAGEWLRAEPVEFVATAGETVSLPDIVLDSAGLLRATLVVVDARGVPVAGALVGNGFRPQRTDKDGRCEWAAQVRKGREEPGAAQTVVVRAKGYAQQNVTFTPGQGTPVSVTVTLRSGAQVAGRVIVPGSGPVKGVRVHVFDGNADVERLLPAARLLYSADTGDARITYYATVEVGGDGRFIVGDLPPGPYHVVAEKASRALTGSGNLPVPLRAMRSGVLAGTDDLVLTLPIDDAPLTQPLTVFVIDAEGAAVAGALAYAVFDGPYVFAQSAEPGRVRFDALPAGALRVEVSAPGYRPQTIAGIVIDADLAPEPVRVTLGRGATLRGTVQAADGKLPATAFVVAVPERGDGFRGPERARISADGGYELTGLGAETYLVSVVEQNGARASTAWVPSGSVAVAVDEGVVVTHDLVVRPGALLHAMVSDPRLADFGGAGTQAQRAISRNARLEWADARGVVFRTLTPLYGNWLVDLAVAPGDYVVRYVVGGVTMAEQSVTADAGGDASVTLQPSK